MSDLVLRTFRPGDEAAFRRLNEAWISRNFTLEAADREILGDPQTHILAPGGQICIAELNGETVGCCALVVTTPRELELARMTVSESIRGLGLGRRLLQFAIDEARHTGARRLCLESNTRASGSPLRATRLPAPARAGPPVEIRPRQRLHGVAPGKHWLSAPLN